MLTYAHTGLLILRKLEVEPKEGHPSLFAVYTMCHATDQASRHFRGRIQQLYSEKKIDLDCKKGKIVRENIAVRRATPPHFLRTAEYLRIMNDMSMPDNEVGINGKDS